MANSFPPGVDWSFIEAREGFALKGYVPKDKTGAPDAHSGVTIAVGFDLGGRTVASLQAQGLTPDIVVLLTPYLGLKGRAAQACLNAKPLTVTQAQADLIDSQAFNSYYGAVATNYDAAAHGIEFQPLHQGAQTAIVSLAYQYGTNLAKATPNFWRQVTGCLWQAAYENLMNFGDQFPSRRKLEAGRLLEAINSGTLPSPPVV